eukprot:2271820-Amphidinium_carterae.1
MQHCQEVEAASTASGSKRSLRRNLPQIWNVWKSYETYTQTRVNTGYIHDDEAAAADSRQGPMCGSNQVEVSIENIMQSGEVASIFTTSPKQTDS